MGASKSFLVLLTAFWTVAVAADIVAAETDTSARPDGRLSLSVTYEAKDKPVKTILADLSKMTGVTLNAGYNSQDWQVRDRRMNIFVNDLPLLNLMNSIGRVMRFKWSRSDSSDYPSYRLYADRRLISDMLSEQRRRQGELMDEVRARREELCDILSEVAAMSDAEAEALRQDNPYLYLQWKTGMPKLVDAIFRDIPQMRDLFIDAERNLCPPCSLLSSDTKQLLIDVTKNLWSYEHQDKSFRAIDIDDLKDSRMWFEIVPRLTAEDWIRHQLSDFGGMGINLPLELAPPHGWIHTFDFYHPDSRLANADARVSLKCGEEKLDADKAWAVMASEYDAATKEETDRFGYYFMYEPRLEHVDEPCLYQEYELKFEDEKHKSNTAGSKSLEFVAVMKALADATGYCVVTDSFSRLMAEKPVGEKEFIHLLDSAADDTFRNWEKRGPLIEFSCRDWFRKRATQIPDEWIEKWRKALITNGTLTLEEYAGILALDLDQIAENIAPDDVLGRCCIIRSPEVWNMIGNQRLLRLYLRLDSSQRAFLFGEEGLNMRSFTPEQWKLARDMLNDGHRSSWDNEGFWTRQPDEIVLKGSVGIEQSTGRTQYLFNAVTVDGESNYGWHVELPLRTHDSASGQTKNPVH